ncbi:MAG: oxidative damage protection protein [Sandaracinaceae bacterium]|nr:oxidative damage protection protein [Sandaracinaceae bacterium]MDW8245324.1 oxidative damage protection protein [Sandaracinaceae bacterium]
MARMVFCQKLKREAEGLDRPPFPNELGKRIYESISKEAWRQWIAYSTMLINEYRIDVSSKAGTEFLLKRAEEFFFGEGGAPPEGYVPPKGTEEGG